MDFQSIILEWYDQHQRELPWRAKQGCKPDPYHVWLSEIMLQQTTVATVKGYFLKFLGNWPDLHALARADQNEVLAAWAGLGYYARARNLHKCAQIISTKMKGQFPPNYDQLLELPGIGPYTAGAIGAIAFDLPLAAVDGNVERVLSRFFAIKTPLPTSKPKITKRARKLVPKNRPGDFAQSVMDLGATICSPKKPKCELCPLAKQCKGFKLGIAANLPNKLAKKARPLRQGKAFVVKRSDGAVLLRRRPQKGLLGGMLEVPCSPWEPVDKIETTSKQVIEHTFTHFHLVLEVQITNSIELAETRDRSTHQWVMPTQLGKAALPSVMKKVLTKALGNMMMPEQGQT